MSVTWPLISAIFANCGGVAGIVAIEHLHLTCNHVLIVQLTNKLNAKQFTGDKVDDNMQSSHAVVSATAVIAKWLSDRMTRLSTSHQSYYQLATKVIIRLSTRH
jgi:hypothetical protein